LKKAVIIGASSGIGRELAGVMADRGYTLGLAARRMELLTELQEELAGSVFLKRIDVSRPVVAMELLRDLIDDMGGTDTVIISAGICFHNCELDADKEIETVTVNSVGFAAMADVAFNYFCDKGTGHIAGISSFRAVRGGWSSPAYNASKAFVSNYLEGLRIKAAKIGRKIAVTEIRPGLVHTPMTKRKEGFLVAPVRIAAMQICNSIENKHKLAYVTRRYRLIAAVLSFMPYCIYRRI